MKKYSTRIIKKGDIIFLLLVLGISALLCGVFELNGQGQQVNVTVDGVTNKYSLLENQTITIGSTTESYNVIVIKDGQVCMESANCPDKTCVRHKPISKNGEMIICLPNKVFVEIESNIENDIDN